MNPFWIGPFFGLLFVLFVLGAITGVMLAVSALGGWQRLAARYRAADPPRGERFSLQSGFLGWVSYGSCLTIHVSAEGLRLAVMFPFRAGHAPLFIPWSEMHNVRAVRYWWNELIEFEVGSPCVATLRLPRKVIEARPIVPAD